jgi:glycosyltransferase involved in cell wall biosynthesis
VIVPVWNVAPYLGDCPDSILGQLLCAGIEAIAVHDGSTAAGSTILKEYAAWIPRLTVVHRPNPAGPGSPQNGEPSASPLWP